LLVPTHTQRVRHLPLMRLFPLLALTLVAALLISCGGGSTQKTGDTTTILANTAKRLNEVKSVHFDVAIEGDAFIDTNRTIGLRSASGDIVPPDKMQTKIKIGLGSANIDVSLVTIGADKYQTNPVTGQWGPAQEGFDYSPTVLFDKEKGLSTIVVKLRGVEQLADEKINGQDTYHLKGKADRALIDPITSGAIEGDPIAIELWIAKDSSNLVKLVLTEPQVPNKAKPAIWTLTFDKYDQPVTINKPQ
jgi:hypothetical protein